MEGRGAGCTTLPSPKPQERGHPCPKEVPNGTFRCSGSHMLKQAVVAPCMVPLRHGDGPAGTQSHEERPRGHDAYHGTAPWSDVSPVLRVAPGVGTTDVPTVLTSPNLSQAHGPSPEITALQGHICAKRGTGAQLRGEGSRLSSPRCTPLLPISSCPTLHGAGGQDPNGGAQPGSGIAQRDEKTLQPHVQPANLLQIWENRSPVPTLRWGSWGW